MKIGILTFHRAHNYGAVLQCYALQEVLKSMGHDVQVIDYRQPFIEDVYRTFNIRRFCRLALKHQKQALRYLAHISNRITAKRHFESFASQYLSLSKEADASHIPYDYDVYVIGSDQVWNSSLTGGLDCIYWGDFKHNPSSKIIGYAISTSLSDLAKFKKQQIEKYIDNFASLSVREESLSSYLKKERLCKDSTICLDPTLVADKNIWNSLVSNKTENKRYVLIYQARGYKKTPDLLRLKAKCLAKKEDLEIVDLSSKKYSPKEFIDFFRYASCVITTSFHGVVFSVIFNRPLYAIALRDGHDDRYTNLLKSLGAESLIVTPEFVPQRIPEIPEGINDRLSALREESVSFLEENLR